MPNAGAIFYVVGRDKMADGPPRLEPFRRYPGFFDTMCRGNTDAFAFKPDCLIVRFLGHKFQQMFVA